MATPLNAQEREQLILEHVWVVKKTAFAIFTRDILKHSKWEDLHQEGLIGLCHAANKATKESVPTFPRFASFHVRKKLVTFWHKENLPIKLPRAKGELAGLMNRVGRGKNGELLSPDKIVDLLPQHKPEHIHQVHKIMTAKMDPVIEEGTEENWHPNAIAAETVETIVIRNNQQAHLKKAMLTLTPEQFLVISLRYGFHTGTPHTVTKTARELKMKTRQVERLEKEALIRLSEHAQQLRGTDNV